MDRARDRRCCSENSRCDKLFVVSPKLVPFGSLTALLAVSGCVTSHRSKGIVLEAGTQTPLVDATVLASYTRGGVVLVGIAEGCTTYYATKTDDAGRVTIPGARTVNQAQLFPIIRESGAIPLGARAAASAARLRPGVPIPPTPVREIYLP